MTFELPEKTPTTSDELRELEQSAPNVTPKAIRAALTRAAAELEHKERIIADVLAILVEADGLKISAMASQSQAQEVTNRVTSAIRQSVDKLRG